MSQDLSFENADFCFFATIRTSCSRLWFVNNPQLEERILAYLARYQERYQVILYGFIMMGNHYHLLARFPHLNKAAFFRDLNCMIAKLTASKSATYEGGKLWARRVRTQVLPHSADIEEKFLYASLNPVSAGLVEKLSDYPGYNSFSDATTGRTRKFKVVNWQEYNDRSRFNSTLRVADFTTEHTLSYSRLPGYESLSPKEYASTIRQKLEAKRTVAIATRYAEGKGFLGKNRLRKIAPGAKPLTTKTSKRDSHRPLVLTSCAATKTLFLEWYFALLASFKAASAMFRKGILTAIFPPGTYRPPSFCSAS